QLLIKITAPGVPDFYQGTELWDLNLVDPDNRRPIDYECRRALLEAIRPLTIEDRPGERIDSRGRTIIEDGRGAAIDDLLEGRHAGRVKLFVRVRAVKVRTQFREVFERGEYIALRAIGSRADHAFAFARQRGRETIITCVPRLMASLTPEGAPPVG